MAATQSLKTIAGIVMLLTAVYIVYTIISLPSMSMSGMGCTMLISTWTDVSHMVRPKNVGCSYYSTLPVLWTL